MIHLAVADRPDDAVAAAARRVAELITAAVAERGRASVAVSGGGTPAGMFRLLATMDLPWTEVELFQVDERVAPAGHADRNATSLAVDLLGRIPGPGPTVHLMPVEPPDPRAYDHLIALRAAGGFDVVHLGIGDDAHTASWPPGHPVLEVDDAAVALVPEFNGRARLTLTVPAVNSARHRLLLTVGTAKHGALMRLVAGDPDAPAARLARDGLEIHTDRAAVTGSPA